MKFAKLTLVATAFSISTLSLANESVDALYDKAQSWDSSVKLSEIAFDSANEQVVSGIGRLLPNVSGSLSAGLSGNGTDFSDAFDYDTNNTNLSAGISVQQALFNWQAIAGYQAGLINAETSNLQISAAKQSLMMSVAEAYVNVLKAEQSLKLSQSEEKSIARQLEQTKERFNVGLVAITDVHNAQASYDQTKAGLIRAQTQLELAKLGLEILTGYNDELLTIRSINNIPKTLPSNLEFWVDSAMQNNLNIQVSEGRVDLADKGLEVEKAARFPTVGLQAGYSYSSGDAGDNWRHSSNVGVSVSIPIYSGGQVSSSIAQSLNSLTQSELQLESAKRNTRLSIIQLYRTLATNLATINAQEQAIISRESALKATEVGLEVGTQTVVDVLAAQSALFSAQKQLSDTKFDYVLNELRLKQTAGTLSKKDLAALTQ